MDDDSEESDCYYEDDDVGDDTLVVYYKTFLRQCLLMWELNQCTKIPLIVKYSSDVFFSLDHTQHHVGGCNLLILKHSTLGFCTFLCQKTVFQSLVSLNSRCLFVC